MMDASKYKVGYFPVSKEYNKWVEKDHIEKAPIWCAWICATATRALSSR